MKQKTLRGYALLLSILLIVFSLSNCSKLELRDFSPGTKIASSMVGIPNDIGYEHGLLIFRDQEHFDQTIAALDEASEAFDEEHAGEYDVMMQ